MILVQRAKKKIIHKKNFLSNGIQKQLKNIFQIVQFFIEKKKK